MAKQKSSSGDESRELESTVLPTPDALKSRAERLAKKLKDGLKSSEFSSLHDSINDLIVDIKRGIGGIRKKMKDVESDEDSTLEQDVRTIEERIKKLNELSELLSSFVGGADNKHELLNKLNELGVSVDNTTAQSDTSTSPDLNSQFPEQDAQIVDPPRAQVDESAQDQTEPAAPSPSSRPRRRREAPEARDKKVAPNPGTYLYLPPKEGESDQRWVKVKFVREEIDTKGLQDWIVVFDNTDGANEIKFSPQRLFDDVPPRARVRDSFKKRSNTVKLKQEKSRSSDQPPKTEQESNPYTDFRENPKPGDIFVIQNFAVNKDGTRGAATFQTFIEILDPAEKQLSGTLRYRHRTDRIAGREALYAIQAWNNTSDPQHEISRSSEEQASSVQREKFFSDISQPLNSEPDPLRRPVEYLPLKSNSRRGPREQVVPRVSAARSAEDTDTTPTETESIITPKRESGREYTGFEGNPASGDVFVLLDNKNQRFEIKIIDPNQIGEHVTYFDDCVYYSDQKGIIREITRTQWNTFFENNKLKIKSSETVDAKPREYTGFSLDPKPGDKFRVPNFRKPGFHVITLADPNTLEGEILDNHLYTVRGVMYHREDWNRRVADGRITKIEPSVLQSPDVQSQLRQQAPIILRGAASAQAPRSDRPVPPPIPPEPPRERPTAHRTVEPPPIQTTEDPSPSGQETEQVNSGEHTSPEAGMEYIFEFLGKEKLADLHQRFALAAFEQFHNTESLMQRVENEMKFLFATLDQHQKDALDPKLREYNFSSFDAFDTHWQKEGWKILRNIIDRMVAQDLQGFIESDTELHKLMSEQDSHAGAKKAPDTHGGHGAHDSHDTHGSHVAPAQQPKTKEGWIVRAWNRTKAGILTGAATSGIIASLNTWANTSISARAAAGTVGIFATIGQRIFDRSQYEKKLHARDALRADVSARIKGKFLEKQKNIGGERMLSVLDAVLHKGVNVGSESAVHQASLDTDIKHKQDEVLRLLTSASGQGITPEQKAHYLAEAKEIEERLTELRLDRALFIHDQNNPATAYTQTVRDVTNTSSFFSMAWQRATRDVSGDNHGMFGSKADFWKGTVAAALVNGAVGFTLASFLPRTGILDIQSDMARAGTRFGIIGGIKGTQAALLERGKFEAAQRKLLKEARILLEHGEIEKAQRLIVDAQKITTWGDRALAGVKTGLIAGTVGAGVGAGVDVLRNTFFPQDFDSDKNTKVQQYQDVPGPQEKDFSAKPDRGGIKIAPESLRPDSIANDLKLRTFEVNKGDGLLSAANHFQKNEQIGPRLLDSLKENHKDWLSSATTKGRAMGLSGDRLNDFVDKSVLHRWRVEEVERFGVRIPKDGGGWIYTKTLQPGAKIELVFKSDGPHLQIADKNFVTEHAPRVLASRELDIPKQQDIEQKPSTNDSSSRRYNQDTIFAKDVYANLKVPENTPIEMTPVSVLPEDATLLQSNEQGMRSYLARDRGMSYVYLQKSDGSVLRTSFDTFFGQMPDGGSAPLETVTPKSPTPEPMPAPQSKPETIIPEIKNEQKIKETFEKIADTDLSASQRESLLRSFLEDAQNPVKSGNLTFASTATGNPFVELNGQRVLVTRDNIDEVGRLTDLSKDPISVARNSDEIRRGFDELRNPKLSEEVVEPVTPNPDTGKILVPVPDDVQDWLGLVTNKDPNIPANIRAEALRLQNDWVRAYNAADRVYQAKAIDALEELKDQAEAANPGS